MTSGPRPATTTDVVTTALELVGAASVSPDAGPAAKILAAVLESHGFAVSVDDWGNTLGHIDFGPGPTGS